MAILKHVPSHNLNFGDVITYLTKKHNEKNGRPILDEHGEMIDRDEFLIAGINCTPEDFAELCWSDCIKWSANRSARDVKTHQYILSFDPSDKLKGLTLEAAQKEGERFARKNFRGHRCIVCAHADGTHGSGNIHVHIIVCALRYEDREPDPEYMKLNADGDVKPSEYKAGCKHQDTAKLRHYLNNQLQEFCRENGYSVAEYKPEKKVTNREYRAKENGQKKLDKDNELRREKGIEPVQSNFKTKKEDLRDVIEQAAAVSKNWEEFAENLRTGHTRMVEVMPPEQPRIPNRQKQEMWEQYKALNTGFWDLHRRVADMRATDAQRAYEGMKYARKLERVANGRGKDRFSAASELGMFGSGDAAWNDYLEAKRARDQLKMNKDTYQAYAKAAKVALTHNMAEEARTCIEMMHEFRRRQEGYWAEGWIESGHTTMIDGEFYHQVNYFHTTWIEKSAAESMLRKVQLAADAIDKANAVQPEVKEEAFSVDVKISRGEISFKHPDLERWTRGKSLGAAYELESIAAVLAQNAVRAEQEASGVALDIEVSVGADDGRKADLDDVIRGAAARSDAHAPGREDAVRETDR